MKKALLISESSVYTNAEGEIICRGGGEMYMHNLAKSLLTKGYDVTVLAIREFKDQVAEEKIEGVLYKRLPVYSRSSLKLFSYLKTAIKLSREYDLVIANQFVPHLVFPWVKNEKIAITYDVYGNLRFWFQEYGFLRGVLGWIIEKIQLNFDKRYANKIYTISESSKDKIVKKLGQEIIKKIQIIPHAIESSKYSKNEKKEDYMLFVGRFVGYKHPEHVLHILSQVKKKYHNFKSIFVVSRIEKKVLRLFKKTQKELGLSDNDIILKESCSHSELKNLYAKARVFVHPSYAEGQGIVILEALASGTPVVAYDLPAYKGMLIDGKNSLLAQIGDIPKMSENCIELLRKEMHL